MDIELMADLMSDMNEINEREIKIEKLMETGMTRDGAELALVLADWPYCY